MSEPTWTAKMFDENKALKAKVEELTEGWNKELTTVVLLEAKVDELTALCQARSQQLINANRCIAALKQAEETVTVRGQDIPISDFIKNK